MPPLLLFPISVSRCRFFSLSPPLCLYASFGLSVLISSRLSQSVSFYIPYCLPLSCSLHLSFPTAPVFPSFSSLPSEPACQRFQETPTTGASTREREGGEKKKRDMDPVPLPHGAAGTVKSGRTSVATNPAAPTLEAHFSESTTTAALDQLHGCYSYRSEHPFSRDRRSPTTGPAQEPRPPGEGAQWSTEGCNAGASAHVRRGHPLPHSPPLSVLGCPPDPLSSSKIPEPRCALSPGDAHPLWGPGSPCRTGARGGWM